VKVASKPEALLAVLKNLAYHFKRIGFEAGPLSQWLFSALAEAELPVVCVETRHSQAAAARSSYARTCSPHMLSNRLIRNVAGKRAWTVAGAQRPTKSESMPD
jgi:hypothetical protein